MTGQQIPSYSVPVFEWYDGSVVPQPGPYTWSEYTAILQHVMTTGTMSGRPWRQVPRFVWEKLSVIEVVGGEQR